MPTDQEVEQGMYDKGYRYKLTPVDADFKPLFTKRLDQIGPVIRDWKDTKFTVEPLLPQTSPAPVKG